MIRRLPYSGSPLQPNRVALCTVLLWWGFGAVCQCGHAETREPVTITADHLTQDLETETIAASGGVTVSARDVELRGDKLEVDLATNLAHLSGNVEVRAQGQVIQGSAFTLDLKTRRWHGEAAHVSLAPEFFTGGVAETLFARGEDFEGAGQELVVRKAAATSCDLTEPHYALVANRVVIYPEDKLVAKGVKFRVGHTTLAQIPSYTISLKQRRRRQSLVPVIGYNEVEGAFAKTSYNYQADEARLGTLYLDLMQKRGIGLGVEQEYSAEPFWGVAYLYGLRDKRTGGTEVNARLRHTQVLSDSLEGQLNLNFTRNNTYYALGSSSLNAEVALNRVTDTSQSNFSLRQQRSRSRSTRTSTTSSLRHRQQFSDQLSLTLTSNFRRNDTFGGQAADEELNTTFELLSQHEKFDLLCKLEDRTDLDNDGYTGDNFLFALERLPEIVARTDSFKLGNRKLFGMFPVRAEASLGKFRELPAGQGLTRTFFRADLNQYTRPLSSATSLSLNGSFLQTLYSDQTAQYVLNYGSTLNSDLTDHWNFNLGYRKQQPAGYSPFRFDFASRYESMDARLSFDRGTAERFDLSSGYDFERQRYRDLIFQYSLMPNDTYFLTFSGGYDLENGEFRDLLTGVKLWQGERLAVDLNTRYSPFRGELTRVNTYLFWQPHRLWQLEALSGWNGFTNQFDFNQVKVTRDLHCWEAFVTWDQQRRELRLDLALKAFPAFDTRFGVGQSGQLLNTSVGQVF